MLIPRFLCTANIGNFEDTLRFTKSYISQASSHQIEVSYNDVIMFNATLNDWNTNDAQKIANAIHDGRKIPTRGKVLFSPFLFNGSIINAIDEQFITYSTKHELLVTTTESSMDCDRVRCHSHGQCSNESTCLCHEGYTGETCSRFSCAKANECSRNGRLDIAKLFQMQSHTYGL